MCLINLNYLIYEHLLSHNSKFADIPQVNFFILEYSHFLIGGHPWDLLVMREVKIPHLRIQPCSKFDLIFYCYIILFI